MSTPKGAKKKIESKTWWGILATVVGAVAGGYSISLDPTFLVDGFQIEEDYEQLMAFLTVLGGWALKNWGLRTAERPVR